MVSSKTAAQVIFPSDVAIGGESTNFTAISCFFKTSFQMVCSQSAFSKSEPEKQKCWNVKCALYVWKFCSISKLILQYVKIDIAHNIAASHNEISNNITHIDHFCTKNKKLNNWVADSDFFWCSECRKIEVKGAIVRVLVFYLNTQWDTELPVVLLSQVSSHNPLALSLMWFSHPVAVLVGWWKSIRMWVYGPVWRD